MALWQILLLTAFLSFASAGGMFLFEKRGDGKKDVAFQALTLPLQGTTPKAKEIRLAETRANAPRMEQVSKPKEEPNTSVLPLQRDENEQKKSPTAGTDSNDWTPFTFFDEEKKE